MIKMKPYSRAERISARIQHVITELLTHKIQDPRLEMATVSSVKMTSDLRIAYVYIAVFGDEKRILDVMEGFKNSRGFIKKRIAPKLKLKYMPDLQFFYDDSFDKAARLDELINSSSTGTPDQQQ